MLFGRKDAPEIIKIQDLDSVLDKLFENKLKALDKNGSSIKLGIDRSVLQFRNACDTFELIDVDPNVDNLYMPNIKSIKSQKAAYANALKNILDIKIDNITYNSYENYLNILEFTIALKNKILGLNAAYKQMLYSYAGHTKEFKKMLLAIDGCIHTLDSELAKNKDDYNRYITIKSLIAKINDSLIEYNETYKLIDNNVDEIVLDANRNINRNNLIERIGLKNNQLIEIKDAIQNTTNIFLSNFLPIQKLSRKFDHLYDNKPNLSHYLSNPLKNIDNEKSAMHFIELIKLLKQAISSNKIEVRNSDDAISQLDKLIKIDILNMNREIKNLTDNELHLSNALNIDKLELETLDNIEKRITDNINNKSNLKELLEKINSNIKNFAISIENAFFKEYNKRITINLKN